jgi:4-amino-4-deoxy-L-arabinose transferase-like glycosyltransferase
MATSVKPLTLDALRPRLPLVVFGVGLFTALVMVFVGWRVQTFVANSPDPYVWQAMARSLLKGEGFAPYGSVLNRRGPLYPALIALIYLVTGERPVAVQLVQALMFGGISWLAFDIGRRLYNLRTGVIAAVICALHPALLRYVADFHLETFLTFLSTLALWRSVRFLEAPSARNGALFGAFAALAALIKPVVLLHPLAFAAWWVLRERNSGLRRPDPSQVRQPLFPWLRGRWFAVAAIFLTMGAVILPWTYRNYRSSGHVVLVTTGFGDAFLRGYIFSKPEYATLRLPPYTYAENESNASFQAICEEQGTVWQRNDVESERILMRASKEKLLADPAAFVRKFVVQLFTFWYEMTSLTNSLIAGGTALALWVLALVGWQRARKEGYLSWPLFLPIFCLNVALAILLALGRYSVPVMPALAVLAAFGVDTLLSRRSAALKMPPAAPA